MSRMFKSIDQTWNVFVGCLFDCTYCNARRLALTRLKHNPRYKDGFKPHLVESELKRTFQPGQFIFVAYMGDISFATYPDMVVIFNRIIHFPETRFLIQSKDPGRFHRWNFTIPPNVYLGTTIETNRYSTFSKAPPPLNRYREFASYPHPHKFLSIEPIMDFDLDDLVRWVGNIKPDIIEVGADNYHNRLPEPPWEKVEKLLANLRNICPNVIEKDGLERLKERR